MIGEAPTMRAAITAERPTPPAPNTARLEPAGGASALSTVPVPVWMPQPSGAASSNGMSAGQHDDAARRGHRRAREARLPEEVRVDGLAGDGDPRAAVAAAGHEVVREERVAVVGAPERGSWGSDPHES